MLSKKDLLIARFIEKSRKGKRAKTDEDNPYHDMLGKFSGSGGGSGGVGGTSQKSPNKCATCGAHFDKWKDYNQHRTTGHAPGKVPVLASKRSKKRVKACMTQSATSGSFNALLRCSVTESAKLISVTEPVPTKDSSNAWLEGPKVKVILISEGLGNRRDMNFYGPEAIDSAPFAFEGAHCFLNHPSYSEERDIPERRVQDVAGYFKNVQVDVVEGRRCVTGEIHFDLSETGRMGYNKMLTALHYQTEFPGADREYVGLSVNADGESEPRRLNLEGEDLDVNYVTKFTNARSTDIVTLPARGGKALALVESIAGAEMRNKEVRTMLVKRLQAIHNALKEAKATDDKEKKESLLTESSKIAQALLKDALDAASRSKVKESETSEEESDAEEADDMEDEQDAIPEPGHKIKKTVTKTVHHIGDDDGDDDEEEEKESEGKESDTESEKESETHEANRLAVEHLIAKSELEPELFDVEDLAHRGLREAKREIHRMKRVAEAWTRRAIKIVGDVSPAHAAKFSESGKSGNKADNTALFADCSL